MVKTLQTWFLYLQIGKWKQFWKLGDEWIRNPTRYDTKSVVEPNCLRLCQVLYTLIKDVMYCKDIKYCTPYLRLPGTVHSSLRYQVLYTLPEEVCSWTIFAARTPPCCFTPVAPLVCPRGWCSLMATCTARPTVSWRWVTDNSLDSQDTSSG